MAVYRTIHISFWQDPFVLELTPEEKYFYIYLMTNSKTNQLGCYEISKKIIRMETGYNEETVDKLIARFIDYKKILYSDDTREMLLINWYKYSWSKSPKVEICIKNELLDVKNTDFQTYLQELFIDYGYSIDSLWIKKEKEKEEKETKHNNKKRDEYQKRYSDSSFEMKCVCYLIDSIKADMPDAKLPVTDIEIDKWCDHIEKMVRLDKRTQDNIYDTLLFARTDTFWKSNIRSTSKFREKYETLFSQKGNKRSTPLAQPKQNKFNQHPQRQYTDDFYKKLEDAKRNKGL